MRYRYARACSVTSPFLWILWTATPGLCPCDPPRQQLSCHIPCPRGSSCPRERVSHVLHWQAKDFLWPLSHPEDNWVTTEPCCHSKIRVKGNGNLVFWSTKKIMSTETKLALRCVTAREPGHKSGSYMVTLSRALQWDDKHLPSGLWCF